MGATHSKPVSYAHAQNSSSERSNDQTMHTLPWELSRSQEEAGVPGWWLDECAKNL